MSLARYLASLAQFVSFQGVVQPTGGGTGITDSGTAGNVLTSDGAGGWTSAPGGAGAYDLLTTVTAAGGEAYLEVTGIDQTYSDLVVVLRVRCLQNGGGNVAVRFGDHTASGTYYNTALVAGGSNSGFNPTAAGNNTGGQDQVPCPYVLGPDSADPPGAFVVQEVTLYDYADTSSSKEYFTHYRSPQGATSAPDAVTGTAWFMRGNYNNSSQFNVDAVSVNGLSGLTFAAGSYVKIYGRK